MWLGVKGWTRLAAAPVFVVMPLQCSLEIASVPLPGDLPVKPQSAANPVEGVPPRTPPEPPTPPAPPAPPAPAALPARPIALPDEVVLRALDVGQPAFLRCWARAQRIDAAVATKVRLHLEIDETGKVTSAETDSDSPTLSRCLVVVARHLAFPAAGYPAVVDLPLLFR